MAEGMTTRVPVDNRPMTSTMAPRRNVNPIYAEGVVVERQNVLLKNGTTVAIDDYDEDVHGKSVEESDDEYRARMSSAPDGRPAGMMHMPTTIANLQTFDSTVIAQQAAVAAPVVPISPVVAGLPVVTSDAPNPNLVQMSGAGVVAAKTDEQRKADAKKADAKTAAEANKK